jgi:hypothetical protein
MSDKQVQVRAEADAALEWEIRKDRKFTLEEAVARMAGPGAMKGESPVPRMRQAEVEIESWLQSHLADAGGALGVVLLRRIKGSELLLNNFEQPLAVLSEFFKQVLESDVQLESLVRDADVEWGRTMDERPFFEVEGRPCCADDPYTFAAVRNVFIGLLDQLAACR